MCALCAYSTCTDERTCTWVCQKCKCRLPGALGHGRPCSCEGAMEKTKAILDEMIAPYRNKK